MGPRHALADRRAGWRSDEHCARRCRAGTRRSHRSRWAINTGIAFAATDMKATTKSSRSAASISRVSPMMPWGKLGVWFTDPDRNEFFMAET